MSTEIEALLEADKDSFGQYLETFVQKVNKPKIGIYFLIAYLHLSYFKGRSSIYFSRTR